MWTEFPSNQLENSTALVEQDLIQLIFQSFLSNLTLLPFVRNWAMCLIGLGWTNQILVHPHAAYSKQALQHSLHDLFACDERQHMKSHCVA
jgi:hypothetical protein